MERSCDCIPASELVSMSNKELIKHLRKCEKMLTPLKEELQRRREQANTSCPI